MRNLSKLLKEHSKSIVRSWKLKPEILTLPSIPAPMHGVNPRTVLGVNWWNKTRQECYKKYDYCCAACGVAKYAAKYHQWLEAHEVYKIDYAKGRMKFIEAVSLCHFCHNYCHPGRLEALLEQGRIHHAKYVAIIQHGDAILRAAKLKRMDTYLGDMAEWSKWRLVIGRKTYKPVHASYADWLEYWEKQNASTAEE